MSMHSLTTILVTTGLAFNELSYEKRDGLVQVREYFSMMNMLTSSTKGHELEKQMIHIWRLAKYFNASWGVNYLCPVGLSLSGTPLNEALGFSDSNYS